VTQPSVPLAFPTWRQLWTSLDGVSELLAAAEAALQRRASGNHEIPRWNGDRDDQTVALCVEALHRWSIGEAPQSVSARPEIIRSVNETVGPILRAVAWPRWLHLERALLDASATGDLLFAAVVLRTMCEELQHLHAVDVDADQLAILAASSATEDQERLKLYLSVAWASLGNLPHDMVLDGKGWPSLKLMATAMPRLERVRGALNGYVHPNYGNHIAALFPERTSAAPLLLEAVVAVYEAFYALSWAEQSVDGPARPIDIEPLQPWPLLVQRLRSHTLPEIQQTAEDPALADSMNVLALIGWLTAERDDSVDVLRSLAAEPKADELLPPTTNVACDNEVEKYVTWEGARAKDVIDLVCARRAEQLLAGEFPRGAPDASDQTRWLRFNAKSLQLAMLLDQVKAAAFKTQLVRQVTQGNSLGAWLCVRSLIEHRAFAVWLPQELGSSLDALTVELRAYNSLPERAAEVEKSLAKFLAAQASRSKEEQRSWVVSERGGVRTVYPNLTTIVQRAFPESDRFRVLYALASAVMHGRSVRGVELALAGAKMTLQARRVGLLVLERICGWDYDLHHFSVAAVQSVRLEHAAAFGGTSQAETDRIAQEVFGLASSKLLPGVDYTGEGTADNPFCLKSHLEYYQTSYALLAQLGVDTTTCRRSVDYDATGRLCDRWSTQDREHWFQMPSG
jgi:hypothetical protein